MHTISNAANAVILEIFFFAIELFKTEIRKTNFSFFEKEKFCYNLQNREFVKQQSFLANVLNNLHTKVKIYSKFIMVIDWFLLIHRIYNLCV